MRHHTTDPALRVEDIAEREADQRWYDAIVYDGGRCEWYRVWLDTYDEVIKEFATPEEV